MGVAGFAWRQSEGWLSSLTQKWLKDRGDSSLGYPTTH